MGLIIDIIAVLVIIGCAAVAYYKGFVKTFFGFVSAIVALVLACILCKPLATFIKDNTELDDVIISGITSINVKEENNNIENNEEDNAEAENSNAFLAFIDSLPNTITNSLNLEESKEVAMAVIAAKIADVVVIIMSWIAIYVIARAILAIVTIIFNGIMNIPVLKTVNKLAGVVIGLIMGFFRIYFVLAIVYFLSNILDISALVTQIQASGLVAHLYNNNLLIELIF